MEYFHLSGAGNDFLALVEPPEAPGEAQIRAWCTRGLSLGADGLFTLSREGEGVRMEYWNADGLPADLCLNGTRCAARLAFHLGWARERVEIVTGAGPLSAREVSGHSVAVDLPALKEPPREVSISEGEHFFEGFRVLAGVPHYIAFWPHDLATAPLSEAPRLRHHPAFGASGTNVDFVRYLGPHRLEIRTYERGVEGETLACGTGVASAVAVGIITRQLQLPVTALTRGGFELVIDGSGPEHQLPERWSLAGDARLLAHGRWTPEAALLPVPPAW